MVSDEAPLASFATSVPMTPSLPIMAVSVPPQAVFTTSTVPPSTIASIVPPSTIPPPPVHHTEVGSSSGNIVMKQVTIEVPAEGNLLSKSGQADVWLKPLIGPVEKAKLESHSSLTLMNDIVHASLKVNLIGTKMMKRVTLLEQLMRDYQMEVDNWKGRCYSLQIDVETLEESRSTLEQQVRVLTSELAVVKASLSEASKEKLRLETSFSEQLSKASEEIRELKALLAEKEAYAGELVQTLTQTQEDLRESSEKVRFLESSQAALQASQESALAENEKLRNEVADWERDYEILEEKSAIEVSWAFLNSRHDTLVQVSQENFNLESKLAKIKEALEKTQQNQDFPSPVVEISKQIEDDTGIPTPSSQTEPPAAVDVPVSVPSSSQ
ncbi:PREDICTED: uncharacterized protein LOC109210436 [Nicotiana attenuata]|uniref:uncharacterized protein LOC109210436 n=1 Tax=Nicotiana attenuata TaxID=49451 RepID=UPI000905BA7D|nr:PREDICTED: uncharacterized protein LOC109210436 [Nicotiana attenuata]